MLAAGWDAPPRWWGSRWRSAPGATAKPTQRKAFIGFLQTQIVDRPGVHVPVLNAADNKAFGNYTAHYAVITDFVGDADMTAMLKKNERGAAAAAIDAGAGRAARHDPPGRRRTRRRAQGDG